MKNPSLKLKYCNGLGDFVAWFLHSKAIGWLTKLITGKTEPCKVCSARARAMNVLFPIKVWRLFFKNKNEMIKTLEKEMAEYSNSKTQIQVPPRINTAPKLSDYILDYNLISSSDTPLGEYIVRVQTYKKK
jgi:hypothetical protein